jgi:lipopolysaccharide biosynthesis regulator YciM
MIFNNSSDRIAAQQEKLGREQEALDTYEKVINQVSDLLPGVTEALININEALLPYEYLHGFLSREVELTTDELMQIAQTGGAFNFLEDEPDLYTLEDGELI